jgi:hypothetical protein
MCANLPLPVAGFRLPGLEFRSAEIKSGTLECKARCQVTGNR